MEPVTKKQYEWAMRKIETLLPSANNDMSEDNEIMMELSILSQLAEAYEEAHFPIEKPALKEILKLRMQEMNLTQQKLADMLEVSQSRISEYLSGKTEPTLKVAKAIHKKLSVSAEIILS